MTDIELDLRTTAELGKLLSDARTQSGLTRAAAARAVGIHVNRLRQIEQGFVLRSLDSPRTPTRATREILVELCNVFSCTADTTNKILERAGYAPLDTQREYLYVAGLTDKQMEDLRRRAEKFRSPR